MIIQVNIKQIGKKKAKVSGMSFHWENKPLTVRELIKESVHTCVTEYNERVRRGEFCKPLSEEEIEDMASVGKIAFGINYGGKEADEGKAIENALLGYEDGLFRIFIGDEAAGDLDDEIHIEENSEVTFIRLVMLSGRMW